MKKQFVATLALSTAVLVGAGTTVSADSQTSHTTPEISLYSDDVVNDTIGDVVQPSNPDDDTSSEMQPSEPEPPVSDEAGDTIDPGVTETPGTTPEQGEPIAPDIPEQNTEQPSTPDTSESDTALSTPSITEEAITRDDQGNITVKPQVVSVGQIVIGTQNGQLIVQDDSGTMRLADATEFGGQVNDNGTVSFKTADGTTVTLPETGDSTVAGVVIGGILILAGLSLGFKDKLKGLVTKAKIAFKKGDNN